MGCEVSISLSKASFEEIDSYLCALEPLLSCLCLRVELGRSQLLVCAEVGALGRVDHRDRDGLYCGRSHGV